MLRSYYSMSSASFSHRSHCILLNLRRGLRRSRNTFSQQEISRLSNFIRNPLSRRAPLTIAQAYQNQPANQKDINKAVQVAASSNPPCKSYIKCIGDYVAHFSGEENFQLLKYLDNMGSRLASYAHHCSTLLHLMQPLLSAVCFLCCFSMPRQGTCWFHHAW